MKNVNTQKLKKAEEHLDKKIFGLALEHLPVLRNILIRKGAEKNTKISKNGTQKPTF